MSASPSRLGAAIVVGDNDRFFPEVERARDEAVAAGRGLYATDVACTVPAQVVALTASTTSVDPQATAEQLDTSAAAAAAAAVTAAGLEQAFAAGTLGVAWTALPPAEQQRLAGVVTAEREKAQRDESAARAVATAARERQAAAARAEEEQRRQEALEREEQAARKAEAAAQGRARAKAAEAAARARATTRKKVDPKPDTSSGTGSKSSSGGGPAGYTGPRCYAPGGKTWKPC